LHNKQVKKLHVYSSPNAGIRIIKSRTAGLAWHVVAYTWGDRILHIFLVGRHAADTTWKTSAARRIILKLILKRRLRIC
jgi:hypothetical protein